MTFDEKCVLSCYEQIAALNEEHNVYALQHRKTKNIFVKKTLTVYNASVYEYLKNNHIDGLPEIIELIEDDGKLIIIEEYISGQTLRNLIDSGIEYSQDQAVDIINQLCRIVQRLHNSSPAIVHRDIKPSNIIITSDGIVKLIDMNAAKHFKVNANQDTSLLGTVGYAAPEQYGFGSSGVQSDIYSIGIVLNELLVGLPPRVQIADGWLGEIVEKCTKLDPKDRYLTIEQLILDLNPELKKEEMKKSQASKYRKYLLPGFRSGNATNMAIAIAGYSALIILGLLLNIGSVKSNAILRLEKTTFILCGLVSAFFLSNYLNVWSVFKIDKIKNQYLKAIVVALACVVIVILMILVMVIIESGM